LVPRYLFSDQAEGENHMETETRSYNRGRKSTILLLLVFLPAFLLYYSIMSIVAPGRKLSVIKDELSFRQDESNINDERIASDSVYLNLLKQKGFLQSKITMAETDSIYLTINLNDSTANIEISGVVVHTSKMKKIATSNILGRGDDIEILEMLSLPMSITNDYSTIKKEPLMIKMAPRDTSEYKPDIIPDTSDFESVNYIFELDCGIKIHVYQEENIEISDRIQLFWFDLTDRIRTTLRSIASVVLLKVPDYKPFIKIRLPKSDAKILYRAIPYHGQVAVCL
jgi:hypothetical protein